MRMIHVSTDYVFDGEGNRPYREDDAPHPVSAYGRTKLAGEQALQRILPGQYVILRTAWLYSAHGKSFVKTMLELGRTRQQLRVVYDQVGSPTLATNLAQAIITVMTAPDWHPGIYHYCTAWLASQDAMCSPACRTSSPPRRIALPTVCLTRPSSSKPSV